LENSSHLRQEKVVATICQMDHRALTKCRSNDDERKAKLFFGTRGNDKLSEKKRIFRDLNNKRAFLVWAISLFTGEGVGKEHWHNELRNFAARA